jgi:archaellum component FlaC
MFDHGRYEELASLAAVGELLPEEYKEFVGHRQSCSVCGNMVAEIGSVSAATFLAGGQKDEHSIVEGERHRRAREAVARRLPLMIPNRSARVPMRLVAVGVAAALVVGIGIGMTLGLRHAPKASQAPMLASASIASVPTPPAANQLAAAPGELISTQSDSLRWQTVVAELQSQVDQVRGENQKLRENLSASDRIAQGLEARVDAVVQQSNAQAQQLEQAHNDLSTIQSRLTQAQTMMASHAATVNSLQSQLSEKDARLNEVTTSLEREREMLTQGRDVRDLMGARDLHIVDVFDTDGKGRIRKPFGRAFYTQGKSLIFYAFDLPTKNLLDGKFVYAAWGSDSNKSKDHVPHHLGIFYSDDQNQHRWAMKFNDPKVLDEIDTVFVTLERLGAAFTAPKGKPVLEAYFGTPPNHP